MKKVIGLKLFILFFAFIASLADVKAQCPTVTTVHLDLCDNQGDSVAALNVLAGVTDNGGGIAWFTAPTGGVNLSPPAGQTSILSQHLQTGNYTYYIDNASGDCGSRIAVTVNRVGYPNATNFMGLCLEGQTHATVANLIAVGNQVRWYTTSTGGTPLNPTDEVIGGTTYYCSQIHPVTGCETRRKAVHVYSAKVVNPPAADFEQKFCNDPDNPPTISDFVINASTPAVRWYLGPFTSTPIANINNYVLQNNVTYYVSGYDMPCETETRTPIKAILQPLNNAGESADVFICDFNLPQLVPTINLIDYLGGNPDHTGNWTGDLPVTNGDLGTIEITNLLFDHVYNFTYTVSTSNTCPPDMATIKFRVVETKNPGQNGVVPAICEDSVDLVDLFTYLGPNAQAGGTWSPAMASGTGVFNPQVDTFTTYTYSFNDGCSPSATVVVTKQLKKNPGQDAEAHVCPTKPPVNLFTFLGGNPQVGGTWEPPLASGTGFFNPVVDAYGDYTYTFNDGCSETATVTVIPIDIKNPGTSGVVPAICPTTPTIINLFDYLGGTPDVGGVWIPALASGTGIFDSTVDAFGVYTYSFNDNCSPTATVTVTSQVMYNPGVSAVVGPICPSSNVLIDLFAELGGTPDVGGTWVPPLASGTSMFNPQVDAFGVYTYTFNDGCSEESTVTVLREDVPNPGLDASLVICLGQTSGVIDLFDVLGGTPDTGGVWTPPLASGTSIFDPTVDPLGDYVYSFNNACSLDATVSISEQSIKNPGTDGVVGPICPVDTNLIDLFTFLGGTPDTGGTWSPALSSGSSVFDPQVDAFGVYTYSFNDGCSPTATVTVNFADVPSPGTDGVATICSVNPTVIDLFTFLGGTPDVGGVWTPTLASGTGVFDPAVDSYGTYTYTFNNNCSLEATVTVQQQIAKNPGVSANVPVCPSNTDLIDLFTYLGPDAELGGTWSPAMASGTGVFNPQTDSFTTYTYSFNDGCSLTASVTITSQPVKNPGQDNSVSICSDNTNIINLFTLLGPQAQIGGTWSPALASGTSFFDPTVDAFGVYTYSFNDGCSPTASVEVINIPVKNPGVSATTPPICPLQTTLVDLFVYLGVNAQTGGTWSPAMASGTGMFNPAVDPYTTYTYSFNDGCSPTASVTVVRRTVRNPGTDETITLCSTETILVDLFPLLGPQAQTGGVWTPPLSSGTGVFDPQVDTFGDYTYSFNDGCSTTATVTIVKIEAKNPGESAILPEICENSTDLIDLFEFLGSTAEAGGTWSPALASGTSIFNPQVDAFGLYTYSFNDGCSQDSRILITSTPARNPGESAVIEVCPNSTDLIDLFALLGSTAEQGGTWHPSLASGTNMFNPQIDTFAVYTYSFNDGCSFTSTVTVNAQPIQNPGVSITTEVCPRSGVLTDLFELLGPTAEVGGTWSPALASGTGVFNPDVDAFGTYTYSFNDGCSLSATVTITEQQVMNPGQSTDYNYCEGSTALIDLFALLGSTAQVGGTWSPALASGTNMFNPQVDSEGLYVYSFDDGCSLTATVQMIKVNIKNSGTSVVTNPICASSGTTIDLFDLLGGADSGGVWTPALASGTSIFDPSVDSFGVYTYSFNDGCSPEATVTVVEQQVFNPGVSTEVHLCENGHELVDLFALLGSTAEQGGTWSPALASGTNMFNPKVDAFVEYTYSFNDGCSSEATVMVIPRTDCELIIPDGFSPNGDGINDTFEIVNIRDLYPNFTIEIYNRYGNVLYKGNASLPDWDGKASNVVYGNEGVPVGVYFYILNYNDGQTPPKQGRLYLNK
ncbi:MAG: gliding motility-associated C-terminal domain-containing protein [Bacteroidota bacterium]|nr:gliding motility-associated C-terminal domain-containing protein [Bacteroidota bacterium]